MTTLRIATRRSPLALCQTAIVSEALRRRTPGLEIELLEMTTEGDRFLDAPLIDYGGKGVFIKELEHSMLEGKADIAVHSMKDVPAALPPGLHIAAMLEREDPADAFVSRRYENLQALPAEARIGTSSLRRQCQIAKQCPQAIIEPVRGNVGTRLKKLDDGEYDAIILACAGLKRLGINDYTPLEHSVCLPAIGQAAIGIECRTDDTEVRELLAQINHVPTRVCVDAERIISHRLGADCHMPLAAHASIEGADITLQSLIADPATGSLLSARAQGAVDEADAVATTVADELIAGGAAAVIDSLRNT